MKTYFATSYVRMAGMLRSPALVPVTVAVTGVAVAVVVVVVVVAVVNASASTTTSGTLALCPWCEDAAGWRWWRRLLLWRNWWYRIWLWLCCVS